MNLIEEMKNTMKGWLDDSSIHQDWTQESDAVRLHIYTSERRFNIIGVIRNGKPSYLGCTYMLRKCLPGENWNRGGDLSDGEFSQETWLKIMANIVKIEVLKTETK
jgi:hypothetical protein